VPVFELQGRWVALVWAGVGVLGTDAAMRAEIECESAAECANGCDVAQGTCNALGALGEHWWRRRPRRRREREINSRRRCRGPEGASNIGGGAGRAEGAKEKSIPGEGAEAPKGPQTLVEAPGIEPGAAVLRGA
jgi:hypothetical protein